jgi:aspartate aminotransferase
MNDTQTTTRISSRIASTPPSATLAVSSRAAELRQEGVDVVDFGAGQPDFDTPVLIKDRAIEALQGGFTKYTPTGGMVPLKKAVTARASEVQSFDLNPQQVVVANGAKHALFNALYCLCDPGDEVICISPYWTSYPEQIQLVGATPVILQTDAHRDYAVDPAALAEAITDRTRVLILNSPNNPTGRVYDQAELEAIAEVLRKAPQVSVLSDEIYDRLVYAPSEHIGFLRAAPDLADRVVIIGSVSKSFAMTGWRIGWSIAPLEISKAIETFQSHATSCANSFAQKGALAALLADSSINDAMVTQFDKRRLYMFSRLSSMQGIDLSEPQGAFYAFADIRSYLGKKRGETKLQDSIDFCKSCLDETGVSIVPGAAFGMNDHIRFSYATSSDEIEKGLDRFEEFIETLR